MPSEWPLWSQGNCIAAFCPIPLSSLKGRQGRHTPSMGRLVLISKPINGQINCLNGRRQLSGMVGQHGL